MGRGDRLFCRRAFFLPDGSPGYRAGLAGLLLRWRSMDFHTATARSGSLASPLAARSRASGVSLRRRSVTLRIESRIVLSMDVSVSILRNSLMTATKVESLTSGWVVGREQPSAARDTAISAKDSAR